jgi:hypothetical protein
MVKRKRLGKSGGMPKDPWFKKRMGDDDWGIVPINYKGGLLFAILILINIFASWYFDIMDASWIDLGRYLIVFFLSILIFIEVSKKNTRGLKR